MINRIITQSSKEPQKKILHVNIGGAYGGIARLIELWFRELASDAIAFDYLCPAFSNHEAHEAHIREYCRYDFSREFMQLLNPEWKETTDIGEEAIEIVRKNKNYSFLKTCLIKKLVPKVLDDFVYSCKEYKRSTRLFSEKFMTHQPVDLIHIHAGSYLHVPGCIHAARKAWPKAKIWVHFHNPPVFGGLSIVDKAIIKRQADRLIYASYSAKSAWDELCAFTNAAVVLQNCVDATLYEPVATRERESSSPFIFGTCARLTSVKRVDMMLQAMSLLRQQGVNAQFHIVGDGQEMKPLEALCVSLGIREYVHFFGEQMDVRPYLNKMDCFVMTSRTEGGVPLALLEAMAMGIPAISTPSGGAEEALVDGETGILVSDETPDKLAEAMNCVMQDGKAAERYGKASRDRITEHFDSREMIHKLKRAYKCTLT